MNAHLNAVALGAVGAILLAWALAPPPAPLSGSWVSEASFEGNAEPGDPSRHEMRFDLPANVGDALRFETGRTSLVLAVHAEARLHVQVLSAHAPVLDRVVHPGAHSHAPLAAQLQPGPMTLLVAPTEGGPVPYSVDVRLAASFQASAEPQPGPGLLATAGAASLALSLAYGAAAWRRAHPDMASSKVQP